MSEVYTRRACAVDVPASVAHDACRLPTGWGRGLVSLLYMLQFYGSELTGNIAWLAQVEMAIGNSPQWREWVLTLSEGIGIMGKFARLYGLPASDAKCTRIREYLLNPNIKRSELAAHLRELRERFGDELKARLMLCLSSAEAAQYQSAGESWKASFRFQGAKFEAEESDRCFALGRYPSAVHHALLVAEFAILEVGKFAAVPPDHKQNWKKVTDFVAKFVNQSKFPELTTAEKRKRPVLEKLLPFMVAAQSAWRDKVNHAGEHLVLMRGDMGAEAAERIITAVKSFAIEASGLLPV